MSSQTTAYCMICGGPAPCETHTFHGEVPVNKTTHWQWGMAPTADEQPSPNVRTDSGILVALAESQQRHGETLAAAVERIKASLSLKPPGFYREGWWKCYMLMPERNM